MPTAFRKFNVAQNGKLVKITLVAKPAACIGTVPYFVTFDYNGIRYEKQTRGSFCEEHNIGDLIDMKVLDGDTMIMWPSDDGVF